MTDRLKALLELNSTTCYCGRQKASRMSFCGRCYHDLPLTMRQALYKRIGSGYEAAYEQACAKLDELHGVKRETR